MLPDQVQQSIDRFAKLPSGGALLHDTSIARSYGADEEDAEQDGHDGRYHVVCDGCRSHPAGRLRRHGGHAADETGDDQGNDHHLQHPQEEFAGERDVHLPSLVSRFVGVARP